MKTIRQIRAIQRLYQFTLFINIIVIAVFAGAILQFYDLSTPSGNLLTKLIIISLIVSCIFWFIIKRLRCPVCRNVFVGKESPQLLTNKCRHCGRRSGDTH